MSELAAFQRRFAEALAGGEPPAWPGFAVYLNTTAKGVEDALRANYPVTASLLGEDGFRAAAAAYAAAHPPLTPVLAAYGRGFADFLEAQPWTGELPYLADVARLERLRTEAHVAIDGEPLHPDDLGAVAAEDWLTLRLPLHPATRFAWLATPAFSIWAAYGEHGLASAVEPDWKSEGVLVTRPWGEVQVKPICAAGHRMLSGLRRGETAGEAAIAVAGLYPEADISSLFARLVASGALSRPEAERMN